jgi:hypothetical protein
MSAQNDSAGGAAAPPEDDGERPSLAAALSRVETLVSALEADGVRVSKVDPALAPEHLRDDHVTVTLTLGLPLDEPPAIASSDDVRVLDSSEGMPATSAGSTATDGGTAATSPTPASPAPRPVSPDTEPAVRDVQDRPAETDKAWYCSVCGHGPMTHSTAVSHRTREDRCDGAEIVAEEPADTIPALSDEAWYCQDCGKGPGTRRAIRMHAVNGHDADVAVTLDSPELSTDPRDPDGAVAAAVWPASAEADSDDEAATGDLPDALSAEVVATAAAEYEYLGDVAKALDVDAGTARVALVHTNHYADIREGGPTGAVDDVGCCR